MVLFCVDVSPTEALDGVFGSIVTEQYAMDGDDESGDDSHLTKSPMEALQW